MSKLKFIENTVKKEELDYICSHSILCRMDSCGHKSWHSKKEGCSMNCPIVPDIVGRCIQITKNGVLL